MTNLHQEAVQFVSPLQNGMTPLRHAVQHSLQAVSTVKTLLEYNASCSVTDNHGLTLINHLSNGTGSKDLSELLHLLNEEQKQCRVDEVCGELKAKMAEIEDIISTTTGLDDLKLQLIAWAKEMFLVEKRKALGLKINELRTPHIVFLGNPKAEKLEVARTVGRLIHFLEILSTDKVRELQTTNIEEKIKEAEGGVLFVDLLSEGRCLEYWLERIVRECMSAIDSKIIVVILAGISKEMKHLISSNKELSIRATKFFVFSDHNTATKFFVFSDHNRATKFFVFSDQILRHFYRKIEIKFGRETIKFTYV